MSLWKGVVGGFFLLNMTSILKFIYSLSHTLSSWPICLQRWEWEGSWIESIYFFITVNLYLLSIQWCAIPFFYFFPLFPLFTSPHQKSNWRRSKICKCVVIIPTKYKYMNVFLCKHMCLYMVWCVEYEYCLCVWFLFYLWTRWCGHFFVILQHTHTTLSHTIYIIIPSYTLFLKEKV